MSYRWSCLTGGHVLQVVMSYRWSCLTAVISCGRTCLQENILLKTYLKGGNVLNNDMSYGI